MEFKGTKGVWSVEKYEKDSQGRACYRVSTYIRPNNEELESNARLIAAAPELLEALDLFAKTFKNTIGYQSYEVNVFDELNKRYISAIEAINKALK